MKPVVATVLLGAAVVTAAVVFYTNRSGDFPGSTLARRPVSKIRLTAPLTDNELKLAVGKMRQRHDAVSDKPQMIALGAKMFFDPGFSENGKVSCATCHQPEKAFTDGKQTAEGLAKTAMNAPTLINSYATPWFFWNGRADSLEAQSLGPVENAKEHGFSRAKVAQRITSQYKVPYEELFGPLPKDLPTDLMLPPPAASATKVSSEVAAYALATLGSSDLQKSILRRAQGEGVQPVDILKTMSAGTPDNPNSFDQLPSATKDAVNTVFANFGRAIAAFERTIVTTDAPFDRFADRLASTATPEAAMLDGFGEAELRGLRLFTGRGNCTLCHQGSHFTDGQFHNIGMMALNADTIDLGRSQGLLIASESEFNCLGKYFSNARLSETCRELQFIETESAEAVGAFKTPTLRNLRDTAPYGHDGRFPSLGSILQHYNHLAVPPAVGHIEESLAPLGFKPDELKDLESFLESLSSSVSYFKGE